MALRKTLETVVYPKLPVAMQNALVSTQGLIFRRRRFSPNFHAELARAIDRANWSADRLTAWQVETARDFLRHAGASPYWGKRFVDAGFDVESFRAPEDIRRVPILEKVDLRHRAYEIAHPGLALGKLYPVHTSGTTGAPISVASTAQDQQRRMAYLYRMFALFGIAPMTRSVRFSGRTLFPGAARNRIFWRMNVPMNQMLMSSYDLHPDNLPAYVARLARFRPELIDGYPSSIFVLARFINASGEAGRIRPRAVMTTAETLEDHQRDEISRAFGGCPVINQYASSEGAPFITQDTNGEMVVNTDTGIFEFVRPGTDEPAAPGELAEMLLTSFTTHAHPLIRYRIGDSVVLPSAPRHSRVWDMPVVENILGRQEDVLFTPERGYVGRLDPVFKKSPSTIVESQIVQTAPMAITLRVVPDRSHGYHPDQLIGIMDELRQRLGDIAIKIEEVEALPRGANGKLRAVIGLPAKGGAARAEQQAGAGA